jgi:hypothetical protein
MKEVSEGDGSASKTTLTNDEKQPYVPLQMNKE